MNEAVEKDSAQVTLAFPEMKAGPKTSEFKFACLGAVVGLALIALGHFGDNPDLLSNGVQLVEVVVAGYGITRAVTKRG